MAEAAFKQKVVASLQSIKKDVQSLESEKRELEQDIADRNALGLDIRRALHWVLKVGNLKRSVEFYSLVFGMKLFRHEEFSSGCDRESNAPRFLGITYVLENWPCKNSVVHSQLPDGMSPTSYKRPRVYWGSYGISKVNNHPMKSV